MDLPAHFTSLLAVIELEHLQLHPESLQTLRGRLKMTDLGWRGEVGGLQYGPPPECARSGSPCNKMGGLHETVPVVLLTAEGLLQCFLLEFVLSTKDCLDWIQL